MRGWWYQIIMSSNIISTMCQSRIIVETNFIYYGYWDSINSQVILGEFNFGTKIMNVWKINLVVGLYSLYLLINVTVPHLIQYFVAWFLKFVSCKNWICNLYFTRHLR